MKIYRNRFIAFIFVLVCLSMSISYAQPFVAAATNSTPFVIPAGSFGFSNINVVAGPPVLSRVRVQVQIVFPTDGDLLIQLVRTSPIVVLTSHRGSSGADYQNTVFDDFAATPVAAGVAPFAGMYQPDQTMMTLNGFNPVGTWQLIVTNSGVQTGVLNSWSLEFNAPFVLPVEMVSFTANSSNNAVALSWRTESETDNSHFNLYRSTNPANRGDLTKQINGHGTSAIPNNYSFTDRDVVNGTTYYYRIADVTTDGSEHLNSFVVTATPTDQVSSEVPGKYKLSQNFPNPFNPTTEVSYTIPEAGTVRLTIYDVLGKELRTLVNGYQAAKTYQVQFDASNLPSGTYYYSLKANNFSTTKMMSLTK